MTDRIQPKGPAMLPDSHTDSPLAPVTAAEIDAVVTAQPAVSAVALEDWLSTVVATLRAEAIRQVDRALAQVPGLLRFYVRPRIEAAVNGLLRSLESTLRAGLARLPRL